jgi:hypothetical protein
MTSVSTKLVGQANGVFKLALSGAVGDYDRVRP